jgi:hypothetical protein
MQKISNAPKRNVARMTINPRMNRSPMNDRESQTNPEMEPMPKSQMMQENSNPAKGRMRK